MGLCESNNMRDKNTNRNYNKENEKNKKLKSLSHFFNGENPNTNYNKLKGKNYIQENKPIIKNSQNSYNENNDNCNLPTYSQILEADKNKFLKGEKYFHIIKDSNKTNLIERNNNGLSEKIELFFSLVNVQNPNNIYSFSISIINNKKLGQKTFLGELDNGSGKEIEFGNSVIIDYFFEREQIIIIQPKENDKKLNYNVDFVLSKLLGSRNNNFSIDVNDIGKLLISYKKLDNSVNKRNVLDNEISSFQFTINLNNNIFSNSNYLNDIFYIISSSRDGKKWRPVYKSYEYNFEYCKPKVMSLISMETSCLCNSKSNDILFELYSPNLSQNSLGFAVFSLNLLESNLSKDQLTSVEIKKGNNDCLGFLKINYNSKIKETFIDFLTKGMQINLEIAIDYTVSNLEPEKPNSLHYIGGNKLNDYENSILSCGEILRFYDYDQLIPVYGFGGIPLGKNTVDHCFNINFQQDPNIEGMNNVLAMYRNSLNNIKLYGPTYFSPVIKKVISEIKYYLSNPNGEIHYYILLILTDGIINDMQETIDSIVEGSKYPLSIIIVGIGTADFSNMQELDGDETPLTSSKGEIRARDIVQFVEFELFKKNDSVFSGTDLAEEVLKEIPRQVEEYYKFWNFD